MSNPRVVYHPRPDATPQGELDALASVYSFVLRCGEVRRAEEMKNAAAECDQHRDGEEAKKGSRNEARPNGSIP